MGRREGQLPDTIDDQVSMENRINVLEKSLAFVEPQKLVGTAEAPFSGTWTNYSSPGFAPCRYYRDPLGMVHLSGVAARSGNWTALDTIFTLPVDYRPGSSELFPAAAMGSTVASYAELHVLTNGVVRVGSAGASTNPIVYISLAAIHFRAAT